jgi:hypothetical protein
MEFFNKNMNKKFENILFFQKKIKNKRVFRFTKKKNVLIQKKKNIYCLL